MVQQLTKSLEVIAQQKKIQPKQIVSLCNRAAVFDLAQITNRCISGQHQKMIQTPLFGFNC
ncbi:MAG: hypothetical protein CMM01_12610 [Rhodopirellula sp.]|nr:hypothetical protein [Rhodopirellula sp.]